MKFRWFFTFLVLFPTGAMAERDRVMEMIEQAEDLVEDGKYKQALAKYKSADDLAVKINKNSERGEILTEMAKLHFNLYDYDQSYALAKAAMDLTKSNTADDFVNIAIYAIKVGKHEEAEKYFSEATKKAGSHELIAKVHFHRSINNKAQGKYVEALLNLKTAREHHLKLKDMSSGAERLLDIANTYKENLSNYSEAFKYYRKARSEFEIISDIAGQQRVDIDLANSLVQIGEVDRAIAILKKVAKSIDRKESPYQFARTIQMLANAYYRTGDFEFSEGMIEDAFHTIGQVKEEPKKNLLMIDAYNLMAMIDGSLNRVNDALLKFNTALRLASHSQFKREQAYLYNNIGYWQRRKGDLVQAISSMKKAIALDRELGSEEGLAYDYRNLGLALADKGDLKLAEYYIKKSMELSKKNGIRYNTIQAELGLASVMAKRKDWPNAYLHYKKVAEDSVISQFKMDKWQAHAGVGLSSFQLGDLVLSKKHFERAFNGMQEIRNAMKSDQSRISFKKLDEVKKVYSGYRELLATSGETDDLAKLEERWKNF